MLFISVILSGCLSMVGRLFTVREQMCEFDDYYSIQIDQGVAITLLEPVLLENDVYLMMDARPTSRFESAEGVVASYVFTQLQLTTDGLTIPTGQEIEFRFLFVPHDNGLVLSGIRSSEIPAEILESAVPVLANSAEMAQQACHFSINPLSTSVMLEIDHDMLGLLPARQTLVSWLGSSIGSPESIGDLSYEFQLKGEEVDSEIVRIYMDFDAAGDQPLAIEASFARYSANIDVPAGTLQMKLY